MEITNQVCTLSKKVHDVETHEADLDQALDVVGLGTYNLKYCLVLALILTATILEPMGNSYLLPAAKCDLNMSNSVRGFISSIPYIGIVVMSYFWGYLVDTRGRKPIVIISALGAGVFGVASGFMPELISFIICKSIGALCLSCLVAAPYSYLGEIVPKRHRDLILLICNGLQVMGTTLISLYAWAILPSDFRIDFGAYDFRPWRLLCIVYPLHLIIFVILLLPAPESPKYLISQGRHDETLVVLRTMYAANQGKAPKDFPIKALKIPEMSKKDKIDFLSSLKQQTVPLLEARYCKWLLLNGFLLFGVFNVLNGLGLWVPDTLNKVFIAGASNGTACEIMTQGRNTTQSADAVCNDSIDTNTYAVNSAASFVFGIVASILGCSVRIIGKKAVLVLVYLIAGLLCITANLTTQPMVFAVVLSALKVTGTGVGAVSAFTVEIFPTNLRGMAVGLTMMLGRMGAIVGSNFAGAMVDVACEAMFYLFGGLMLLCCAMTFLLPESRKEPSRKNSELAHL